MGSSRESANPPANDAVACRLPCWGELKRHVIEDHGFKQEELLAEEGAVFVRLRHPKSGLWFPAHKYPDDMVMTPSIIDWVARRCRLTPKDLSLDDGTGVFVTVVPPPIKLPITSAAGHRNHTKTSRRTKK